MTSLSQPWFWLWKRINHWLHWILKVRKFTNLIMKGLKGFIIFSPKKKKRKILWTLYLKKVLKHCYHSSGNKIGPDTLANLFESLSTYPNNIRELRVAGQQQDKMGFRSVFSQTGGREPEITFYFVSRVESRIAEAVCKNEKIIKLGMKFEFKDVLNRWAKYVILY